MARKVNTELTTAALTKISAGLYPWRNAEGIYPDGLPQRIAAKKEDQSYFRGINALITIQAGYVDPRWATPDQAFQISKASLKPGEIDKKTEIVIYQDSGSQVYPKFASTYNLTQYANVEAHTPGRASTVTAIGAGLDKLAAARDLKLTHDGTIEKEWANMKELVKAYDYKVKTPLEQRFTDKYKPAHDVNTQIAFRNAFAVDLLAIAMRAPLPPVEPELVKKMETALKQTSKEISFIAAQGFKQTAAVLGIERQNEKFQKMQPKLGISKNEDLVKDFQAARPNWKIGEALPGRTITGIVHSFNDKLVIQEASDDSRRAVVHQRANLSGDLEALLRPGAFVQIKYDGDKATVISPKDKAKTAEKANEGVSM